MQNKISPIQLLVLDVDGVLTSGSVYYSNQGLEMKAFHIQDGLGLKLLQKAGLEIAVISAKQSDIVERRLKELNVSHVYLGYEEKLPAFEDLKIKTKLDNKQIAYMGDDLLDMPILKRVGFSITVPGAPDIIKQEVHWITKKRGGRGAVREACDFILHTKKIYDQVIQSYME